MFGRIADKYDLANKALSLGVDALWRERLAEEVWLARPRRVIDLATGSGDLAFGLRAALGPHIQIDGMDFCEPMLEQARRKQAKRACENMSFTQGDILSLPLPNAAADAVTIAFGYRNLADRPRGLAEMRRVLTPSAGRLYMLEFSQPFAWARPFYYFYLKKLLPSIAGRLTGDLEAYRYLRDSIEAFPTREKVSQELKKAGFSEVRAIPMTFGCVALHIARQ